MKILKVLVFLVIALIVLGAVFGGIKSLIYAIQPVVPYVFWGIVIVYVLSLFKSKK